MINLSTRIRIILDEQRLKQSDFANSLGVSANYISLLVHKKKLKISETLAKLIEETYGYSKDWLLYGTGQKRLSGDLPYHKLATIKKIKEMNAAEIDAIWDFIRSFEEIKELIPTAAALPPKAVKQKEE